MTRPLPSRVVEYLRYEPDTGLFFRRDDGRRVGCHVHRGYFKVRVDNKPYYAHRLAWVCVYGEWPDKQIDHINGNPSDNRIENLRLATRSQNMANAKKPTNKCGLTGVYKSKSKPGHGPLTRPFVARVYKNRRRILVGYFVTAEEAHAAYVEASREVHGEFSRFAP